MGQEPRDDGFSVDVLWMAAWALGLLAAGCLLRLLTYAADGTSVQAELFAWVLVGTMASVFSACCAVLAGVKAAEQRLSRRIAAPAR